MNYNLEHENNVIEENDYFKAIVINNDGLFSKMNELEKDKYIDWLNRCKFIKDYGMIVQLNLKKYQKVEIVKRQPIIKYYVDFNGLAAYNDKGGYSFYGTIDLYKRSINAMISKDNTDKYEQLKTIYVYHLRKNEGKVK